MQDTIHLCSRNFYYKYTGQRAVVCRETARPSCTPLKAHDVLDTRQYVNTTHAIVCRLARLRCLALLQGRPPTTPTIHTICLVSNEQ
jgi:hypothetical protein